MIEEQATIVAVGDGVAWVETQRKSTCSACQVSKGCGTSLLSSVLGTKRTRLQVDNPDKYTPGDEVVLGLEEAALVKGSFLLYVSPLIAMLLAALFGYSFFYLFGVIYSEAYQILFSFIGLVFGFWFVSKRSGKLVKDSRYQAAILRKLESPSIVLFKQL